MHELTREQEAKIAEMAMSGHSVRVEPQSDGTVIAIVLDRRVVIGPDGNASALDIEAAYVRLPRQLLAALLGDEMVDEAGMKAREAHYPDHRLGMLLQDDIRAAIEALLAVKA